MADEQWPKLQILHPWLDAPKAPAFVPFSTKIVGWALDPSGICLVELRSGETVIASRTADAEVVHPSALLRGGKHYNKSCGFSFILGNLVSDDVTVPLVFTIRAVARSGDWSEQDISYSGNEQRAYLQLVQSSLAWEQTSLQKLLVYSFNNINPTLFYIFFRSSGQYDDDVYLSQCEMRAKDISTFFPVAERKFFMLGDRPGQECPSIPTLRSTSMLALNSRDFVLLIDPCMRWSSGLEIRTIVDRITACNSQAGDFINTSKNASQTMGHGNCLTGDEYSSLLPDNIPYRMFVSSSYEGEVQVLSRGYVFVNVNGPICDPRRILTILIIKLDRIGDVISMIPAVQHLRRTFPNARISAFVTSYTAPIVSALKVVHEVLVRGCERLPPDRVWDLAVDLRLDADTRSVLREVKAHVKLSAFLPAETQSQQPEHLMIPNELPTHGANGRLQKQHVIERLNTIVGGLAANLASFFPEIHRTDDLNGRQLPSEDAGKVVARAYIVVAPGPPLDVRSWPSQQLAELVARCSLSFGVVVTLVGTLAEAGECARVEELLSIAGVPCENLCDKISSPDLLSIIRASSFFVGADSGPKHIASLFGIPGICVHGGRHSPRVWGSTSPTLIDVYSPVSCSPCLVNTVEQCWNGLLCLDNIDVDDAWRAAQIAWAMNAWRTKHQQTEKY